MAASIAAVCVALAGCGGGDEPGTTAETPPPEATAPELPAEAAVALDSLSTSLDRLELLAASSDCGKARQIRQERRRVRRFARQFARYTAPRDRRGVHRAAGSGVAGGAFVRDRCTVELAGEVAVDALWSGWKSWAEDNGQAAGTKQRFGRDLRAVVPHVKVVRPRDGDDRHRVYRGVALRSIEGTL